MFVIVIDILQPASALSLSFFFLFLSPSSQYRTVVHVHKRVLTSPIPFLFLSPGGIINDTIVILTLPEGSICASHGAGTRHIA
ncbi:MAG: hypothetical protein BYD32DRAFT_305073 [Podila humilis]|nr:MAG: hypothetical protein BYD32DRAFT_305073 [Podila humilis]